MNFYVVVRKGAKDTEKNESKQIKKDTCTPTLIVPISF